MRWLEQVLGYRNSSAPLIEVLGDEPVLLSYRSAFDAAIGLAPRVGDKTVGLVAHNSPEWFVADLGCLLGGAVEVPVPLAFSADQARSLLRGVDVCLVDEAGRERLAGWGDVLPPDTPVRQIGIAELALEGRGRSAPSTEDEDWVCKVVHTSGTTSAPKGVRIRAAGLDSLLDSLNLV